MRKHGNVAQLKIDKSFQTYFFLLFQTEDDHTFKSFIPSNRWLLSKNNEQASEAEIAVYFVNLLNSAKTNHYLTLQKKLPTPATVLQV